MKKSQTLRKLLICALLAFWGVFTLEAATLTVKVKDSYGNPLPGVSVQWVTSQFYTLGTTDVNGEITGTITNNVNYKVKLTYNSTAYQTPTAKNSGTGTNTDNFNTSELKFVTTSGGLPVAGIGVQYMSGYPSGSWIAAGSTDVNGEKSVQVFAFDNMVVRGSANGSLKTDTIPSFPYGTTLHVHYFNTLVKLQSPGAAFLVAGSYVQGGTGKYVFPGTYPVKINNTYSSSVTIAGSLFDKVPIVIVVRDHSNNPIEGAALRGGYGTIPNGGSFAWHASPTEANGITVDWTNPGSNIRSYEAKVNGTTAALTKDINLTGGNVFIFKTNELTLKLLNCAGNGIAGGSARYGIGSNYSTWFVPAPNSTNGSGITTMEAFPGTYSFEMNINQSNEVKQIVFTGTNSLTWTTTKVAINWPYGLAYGGGGGNAWFPDKTGTEMLPGTWNFRFDAPGGSTISPIVVSGCSTSKSPIVIRLIQSDGSPIANGQPSYDQNGWVSMAPTDASGMSIAMLDPNPGLISTQMVHLGGVQVIEQDLTANPLVTYQTSLVTIDFKASDNTTPLEGENLMYYSDDWYVFGSGSTTNGVETMELLPVIYYFGLSYKGALEAKPQDVSADQTVYFQTKLVTIDFKASDNTTPLEGENLMYYSDDWHMFGSGFTTNGVATMELLPLSYYFSLSYLGATEWEIQDVSSNQTVAYQTNLVTIDFTNSEGAHNLEGNNLTFFSDSWRNFGTGNTSSGVASMELLPMYYFFSLSYEGATDMKAEYAGVNQTVPFQTTKVTFDIRDQNDAPLSGTDLMFFTDSWRTFGLGYTTGGQESMELLPLDYDFSLSYLGNAYQKTQNAGVNPLLAYVFGPGGDLLRKTHSTLLPATVSFKPNPVVSNMTISMPAAGRVDIFSVDGKKLAHYKLVEGNSTIDVSAFPVGTYMMLVNYNGKNETHKFVKQ